MTDMLTEEVTEIEADENTDEATVDSDGEDTAEGTGDKARDFTKTRELHDELAAYINEHSGLDPISAAQVFAVTTLRGDFNKLPEQVTKRNERKAELAEKAKKYEGLSPEQIKATKQADRAEASAQKMREKAEAAVARAEALRAQASGSAAELVAAVEAETAEETPVAEEAPEVEEVVEATPARRPGRKR